MLALAGGERSGWIGFVWRWRRRGSCSAEEFAELALEFVRLELEAQAEERLRELPDDVRLVCARLLEIHQLGDLARLTSALFQQEFQLLQLLRRWRRLPVFFRRRQTTQVHRRDCTEGNVMMIIESSTREITSKKVIREQVL